MHDQMISDHYQRETNEYKFELAMSQDLKIVPHIAWSVLYVPSNFLFFLTQTGNFYFYFYS